MRATFRYQRGDLISDLQLGGLPYRIERRLRDEDTGVGLYVIKRVDSNTELLRNGKLIDNSACFGLYKE
ncbi:hypothetical protein [Noviherbaspirillum massiliense]|uniref:hypothetical protein n=1 Tax=Noviherbaspirillum massiliense TaxID=1465823 RepID=UPI0002E7F9AE|nr:hypothetical protein [Noviherbaspirillum massiliense]